MTAVVYLVCLHVHTHLAWLITYSFCLCFSSRRLTVSTVHRDELKVLPLNKFLKCFKDEFMPSMWEVDVHIELNTITQEKTQTFCDFANVVQNTNSLLFGTTSHLNVAHLHTCIEVGMDKTLNK